MEHAKFEVNISKRFGDMIFLKFEDSAILSKMHDKALLDFSKSKNIKEHHTIKVLMQYLHSN